MKLEDVTAEIRPRSDWESVDLGFTLARHSFWRCFSVWWLTVIVPSVVAVLLLPDRPFLVLLLFWWWKPAASRMVLFELSRRLFGEIPSWRQVWREMPRAWTRRFFFRFLWARFSPWTPVTMAVEDLEGLRGKTYAQRSRLVLRRGDAAAFRLSLGALPATLWISLGLAGMFLMLLPEGLDARWKESWQVWVHGSSPFNVPPLIAWTFVPVCALAMSLVDLFVTAGGFGIYVNNRTWIEGWDVELALKRLANRIGRAAALLVALACLAGSPAAEAGITGVPGIAGVTDAESPEAVIREVKSHPDFEVHKETIRIPKSKPSKSSSWSLPGWLLGVREVFSYVLLAVVGGAVVGLVIWLIFRYRHLFAGGAAPADTVPRPGARVVMGMAVAPETLPGDVPSAVRLLWSSGRRHEALALLYRGAISRVIGDARVEIAESDTEGDCLRRVEKAGAPAHPAYFGNVTRVWMKLAYARELPSDPEVEALCSQWPFPERRPA